MSAVKPKRTKRGYSKDEKAAALALVKMNHGNVTGTAKQLGIPEPTLRDWVKAQELNPDADLDIQVDRKAGSIADKFEALIHKIVDSVTPADIVKASLTAKMTSVGILADKLRAFHVPDSDPAIELCRLLGIHRSQLPETLDLPEDYQLPAGFYLGPAPDDIIVQPEPDPVLDEPKVHSDSSDFIVVDVDSPDQIPHLPDLILKPILGFELIAPDGFIIPADFIHHRRHSRQRLACPYCESFLDLQQTDQWPTASHQIKAILEDIDDSELLLHDLDDNQPLQ